MTLIVIVVFSILEGVMGQQNNAQVQDVDNAEQFALLCRIYNVAKNPPINHVDLRDPNKIVNEINAINDSLAEETQFNETEQMGNNSDAYVKPTITREAAVAQAILRRITQKAHNILNEIRKVNATKDIEMVKTEFDQVIFGEGWNESHLSDGALKDVRERANACGNSGLKTKGESAGKNLVVDFFCLCAMRTDSSKEGIENVCGVKVGGKDGKAEKHGWSASTPSGTSSMWASIKNGCGRLTHQHPKSTEEGRGVLEDFLKHLETGGLYRLGVSRGNTVKEKGKKKGMLGTGMCTKDGGSDILCDGNKGKNGSTPGGICVYYGPGNWADNIPWLKKLKNALDTLDTINNQTATIQRDTKKLQMLLHRAEEIYETTNVISEIQSPVQPTNLQTATKRLTAYNAASRYHPHHFILLFVL